MGPERRRGQVRTRGGRRGASAGLGQNAGWAERGVGGPRSERAVGGEGRRRAVVLARGRAASASAVCGMSDALWNRGTPPRAVTMAA